MQVVLRLCRNFDLLFFTLDILKNALLDRLIQERHRHLAGKECRTRLIMFNRVCMRPSIATCTTRIAFVPKIRCAVFQSTLIVAMSSTENTHVSRVHTICRHLTSATSLGEVVDGYLVHPQCAPGMERVVGKTALSVVGGTVPLPQHEVARRAYHYALDPMQNPIKQVTIV